jgi:hypothetical protein
MCLVNVPGEEPIYDQAVSEADPSLGGLPTRLLRLPVPARAPSQDADSGWLSTFAGWRKSHLPGHNNGLSGWARRGGIRRFTGAAN